VVGGAGGDVVNKGRPEQRSGEDAWRDAHAHMLELCIFTGGCGWARAAVWYDSGASGAAAFAIGDI
jgi:hypothetical protein